MTDDERDAARAAVENVTRAHVQAGAAFEHTVAQLATAAAELEQVMAAEPDAPPYEPIREELEAGLRFIHLALAHTRDQLSSLTVEHEALVATLAEAGVIDAESFANNRKLPVLRERERRSRQPDVRLTAVADKYEMEDAVVIDCLERLPLCRARCCTLDFELAEQDLDEGVVRWDYSQPYVIKKDEDGRCVHNVEGRCAVHGARPAACRQYDCRDDRRIWLDFDNRIPAR